MASKASPINLIFLSLIHKTAPSISVDPATIIVLSLKLLSKKNPNIILAGDFNVIPAAEDVYNVKSFEDDALYRLSLIHI